MTTAVRSELYLTSVAIFLNDVPHLIFRRAAFLGLQSWPDEACFSLEILLQGGTLLARYESRETWIAVLGELARLDLTAG